jgi:hypothetical protein
MTWLPDAVVSVDGIWKMYTPAPVSVTFPVIPREVAAL